MRGTHAQVPRDIVISTFDMYGGARFESRGQGPLAPYLRLGAGLGGWDVENGVRWTQGPYGTARYRSAFLYSGLGMDYRFTDTVSAGVIADARYSSLVMHGVEVKTGTLNIDVGNAKGGPSLSGLFGFAGASIKVML